MFGKKRTASVLMISLFDEKGNCLAKHPAAELSLPREVIVALSIEFFDDHEPCEIHSAAVLQRVIGEFMAYGDQPVQVCSLPDNRRNCFESRVSSFLITMEPR